MAKMKQIRVAEKAKRPVETPTLENRRARHEYEILESMEAGLVLTGTEVKALRAGGASMSDAYARIKDGQAWLHNLHIPPYKQGSFSNEEPRRSRKLLLHRDQIAGLAVRSQEKGLTIVPLKLYFTRGMAKVQIGVARGKQLWDKRAAIQKREADRSLRAALAQRSR